jgi:hypothetical protein
MIGEKYMKIIIAGSRTFYDYDRLVKEVDAFIAENNLKDITIISGTAQGADRLGERYATEHNYPCQRFPADWNKYGKSAGYHRNVQMGENADACVVFRVGMSRGSTLMVIIAKEKKLLLKVIDI